MYVHNFIKFHTSHVTVGRTEHGKLPVLALAAGSSLEWGGAALLDATALAAATHALIVTFNFRLGVLGTCL